MKKEIRILGIDDSPFEKHKKGKTLVIGTFFRGGQFLDGVLSTKVDVDGSDATAKLASMVKGSKFASQLHAIITDGIALGGFNIIDIGLLNKLTSVPVIVIIRRMPDIKLIKATLEKIGMKEKIALINRAGKIFPVGKIYAQLSGIGEEEALEIVRLTCTRSLIPEPIRIAHLIGQGIVLGESRGNP